MKKELRGLLDLTGSLCVLLGMRQYLNSRGWGVAMIAFGALLCLFLKLLERQEKK